MADKFQILNSFNSGYQNKVDATNLPPGVLVVGSQNVLINEGERVAVRGGYVLDGQENAAITPIISSYDWIRTLGDERNLRSYQDELEYRYVDSLGAVTWRRLANGWGSAVNFNYAEFWDETQQLGRLLFVNGTSNIFDWSGGITTFASATAVTITKQGTTTWAQEGFYTTVVPRRVVIGGIAYAYTGGENTLTLTGVTPDPTLGGHVAGDVIHQQIVTTPNSTFTVPVPELTTLKNDLIATLVNQVYLGSLTNPEVFVSQFGDFTDYSFASPRLPGDGALFTLRFSPVGFQVQEEQMYITAGKDEWYITQLTPSADLVNESLSIKRLKTTSGEAAQSQAFITKMKNYVMSLSNEPTLDTLGRLELIDTPQSVNISDPVKNDFDAIDFTGGSVFYFQNDIYVCAPAESLVLIYNLAKGVWETPQILPISRFAIIGGQLYGHSSQVPETYQMFVGHSDRVTPTSAGNPINAIAAFSYQQFGDRANKKSFNAFYTEGYITPNTTLTLSVLYNFRGCEGTNSYVIAGNNPKFLCAAPDDGSLGKKSLGKRSLAGRGDTIDSSLPPKFRAIRTFPKTDFYEYQVRYSSNAVDQTWELIGFGPNVTMSTALNAEISE
jgi:hypothetical protein